MPSSDHVTRPADGCWVLHTPNSAYVLHMAQEDVPLIAHWGIAVDDATAVALTAVPADPTRATGESPFDGRECYPSDTGLRFTEPALQLRFPDGGRTVRWQPPTDEIVTGDDGSTELRLHFAERTRDVRLTLHHRVHIGHDVVERW